MSKLTRTPPIASMAIAAIRKLLLTGMKVLVEIEIGMKELQAAEGARSERLSALSICSSAGSGV